MPLESYVNNPDWFVDYGDSPTSSPPVGNDIIYEAGYDPELVLEDFGESFEEYDPTREQFAQERLTNQQKAANLQYDRAYDAGVFAEGAAMRGEAAADRNIDLIGTQLGDTGYLKQALDRQQSSLDIQRTDAETAQDRLKGYIDPETGQQVLGARDIAGQQVGLQRGLTQAEMGERDPVTGEYVGGFAQEDQLAAMGALDLQGENITASAAQQQADLQDQLYSLGIDRDEAIRQADVKTGAIGREEQMLGLARTEAGRQRDFELDRIGRARQTQDIDVTLAQSEISRGVSGARRGLGEAYRAGEADMSGFAGSGARDMMQQKAIQGYAGDAAAGIQDLRTRAGKFSISEQELKAQEQKEKDKFDLQLNQYDITSSGLAAERQNIQGGLDAQTQKYDYNVATAQRGQGEVAAAEARQQRGVDLSRGTQQTAYDRQISQLGGQMSGFDLQDASNKLRFDEQAGRLESQIAQIGISSQGAEAQYNETTGKYEAQQEGFRDAKAEAAHRLKNIQAEIGEIDPVTGERTTQGYLQQGLQNTLGAMGGQFAEDVYGFRDDYTSEVRDRIIDLIRDQGLDETYKLSYEDPDLEDPVVPGDNVADDIENPYARPDESFGESGRFLKEKAEVNMSNDDKRSALANAGIDQSKINELMALPNFSELGIRELIYMTQG